MRLNDRTAIVTGASTGIGAATSLALARRGAVVWAVARNRDRLEKVAQHHTRIHPIVADLTIDADRARLVEAVGRVDILINNAGVARLGLVEFSDLEETRHMFELNVLSMIDLTQRVLPGMLARRSGHICNIGSSVSYLSAPPLTIYSATKYAVEGFNDGLRREVLHRGVGVSLIQPGPVKTAFWGRASIGDSVNATESTGTGIPPEWVANAIVKAIRFDRAPGYRHVAVPRPLGLGRLIEIPGIAALIDLANRFRTRPMDVVTEASNDHDRQEADVIPITDAASRQHNSDR
jgi:short-subunit dehydrogenase